MIEHDSSEEYLTEWQDKREKSLPYLKYRDMMARPSLEILRLPNF